MEQTNSEFYYPAINQLASQVVFVRKEKGFKTDVANLDQKLLLVVSEICEAQEELRDGHDPLEIYVDDKLKPCGFPIEIADGIIRLLDIAHSLDIDIGAAIAQKIEYNSLRPPKHGRQF